MSGPQTSAAMPRAGARAWIGLAVIALPCVIYAMDVTVLYLAVPEITEALRPSASELLWIVDIYGFMVAGWLITMGTLGDRIGRRRLLLIGATAFGVASVLVAFAPSANLLIAARALQGVAGATLAPSTLSLIRNMFLNDRERTLAIGIWVASFSAGAVLGPLIGGAILAHFWWGAVFLINVPVMALLLALGPVLLPEYRDPAPGRLDVTSALQSLGAVLVFMFGLKRLAEGGDAIFCLAAMLAGVLIGAAFFARQRKLSDPMIDVALFRSPQFSAALGINMAGLFAVLGTFFLIAQYLQLVLGMGPLTAGLWTAPSGVAFVIGSMLAPFLVRRLERRMVVACGFFLAAIGFALLARVSLAPGPWLLFAGMMIFCAGLSPIGALTTDIVLARAPPERAGAASAISEMSFEFGGAAGIAVLGSLVAALYRRSIDQAVLADIPEPSIGAARRTLAGALDAARGLTGDAAAHLAGVARAAFVDAMEVACAVAALSALVAGILALRLLADRAPRAM